MGVSAIDIDKLKERVMDTQAELFNLLKQEEQLLAEENELDLIDVPDDRNNKTITLFNDFKELSDLANGIRAQAQTLKKRFDEGGDALKKKIIEEVGGKGRTLTTRDWEAKLQGGKSSVQVVDRSVVPRKYLKPPKPLPTEDKWDVDKNYVARVLTNEEVKKIDGIKMVEGLTLKILPR